MIKRVCTLCSLKQEVTKYDKCRYFSFLHLQQVVTAVAEAGQTKSRALNRAQTITRTLRSAVQCKLEPARQFSELKTATLLHTHKTERCLVHLSH